MDGLEHRDDHEQSKDLTRWWRRGLFPGTDAVSAPRLPRQRSRPFDGVGVDQAGSGTGPRLVLRGADGCGMVFPISGPVTTVGSCSSCDVVLPGLEDHHANLLNEYAEEYELVNCDGLARISGAQVFGYAVLRAGSRIELGPHALTFHLD